jgi:hypothetical protein
MKNDGASYQHSFLHFFLDWTGYPSYLHQVSFNVGAAGAADKFFPNWEALASQEEVRVDRIVLCFMEGFEA